MNLSQFPILTSELLDFLPHRPPMIWVDEVVSCDQGEEGPKGVCRVYLNGDRAFHLADGSVRVSSLIEWIAQAYGYVKACQLKFNGGGISSFERAFLVGVNDCEIDLIGIEKESSVLVIVKEQRNLHPAYLLEGVVTSEDGLRTFGKAKLKVFGGDFPTN